MSIRVKVFYPELRKLLGDKTEVLAEGKTVGECLQDLMARDPGVERLLFDGRGNYRRPVYVFVNREGMSKAAPDTPLGEGDELIIAVLASGG